jgi:integrase/recombinase XerD
MNYCISSCQQNNVYLISVSHSAMPTIKVERIIHMDENRISLRFSYDEQLIELAKELEDARWSSGLKCWHIRECPEIIDILLNKFRGKAFIDYSELKHRHPLNSDKIEYPSDSKNLQRSISKLVIELPSLSIKAQKDITRYRKWMEALRYPESTIQTYCSMMEKFLRYVSPKEAQECTQDDLIRVINEFILPEGRSFSFQNQLISSVKKFYGHIYKTDMDPGKIERPRGVRRLPNVLSKEEVKKILNGVQNDKHRVMLSLIYACGLRRSELLNLLPLDIERSRGVLRIRQSKGYKDRIVPMSEKTIGMIDNYLERYKPQYYLFEGQNSGEQYAASSLQKVLKSACSKAGLRKQITLHWLRHSYATHLLEAGTDLRYIQELLGHSSSRTTEIYTHVTDKSIQKIRSPFDDL